MKWILTISLVLMLAGCAGQEFTGGFVSGVAAMKVMAEDAQNDFIEAVNNLEAETARLNTEIEAVGNIDPSAFVKPETIAAIDKLKEQKDSPTLWIALASMLLGGSGVNLYKNRKTGE